MTALLLALAVSHLAWWGVAIVQARQNVGLSARLHQQAAEAERDAARAAVKAWEDKEASRGMCCWQMEQERDAARAEVARLRDARADDVALVARLSHQVVALRDAITRVLDGPHYIDRDYQDVLLAALDTPAREGGEGR